MLKDFFQNANRFRIDQPGLVISGRAVSVDALRGFDMFWIIGGEAIFKSLDNIFHSPATGFMVTQLDHVEWTGFHFYDLIMPLFLFIVGVAMPFSLRRRLEKEPSKSRLWKHIIRRVIILWILGMVVQGNLLEYDWEKIKFYSNTLQAIASGYLIACILMLYLDIRRQFLATIGLMLIYWMVISLIPVPGTGVNMITPEGNFAIYLDKLLFGRFQDGTTYSWVLSSLNFGATTMLGVFCGYFLQSDVKRKSGWLAIAGIVLIVIGLVWHPFLPSVKHIWTSSFVLFSGGICILSLAIFQSLVDELNMKKVFFIFMLIGSNAIFAYVASHTFDFGIIAEVFVGGLQKYAGAWYYLIRSLGRFLVLYFILRQMYKHKIFIKI